jgi:hypothetical protein
MALELTHWEYSFLLHTCNLGDAARTGRNPFTGEPVEFPIDDGLTDDEIDAIQDVFDENGIDGPEPDGQGYAVYGADGDCLRFRCNDLDAGEPISGIAAEAVVKELSDQILTVILDVARAGHLALTSSVGDCVRIPDRTPDAKLLKRWPDAQSLSSISELRQWFEDSIGGRQVHVPS